MELVFQKELAKVAEEAAAAELLQQALDSQGVHAPAEDSSRLRTLTDWFGVAKT